MLLDKENLVSDAQAITTLGNTLSTNTIDLGATGTIVQGGSPISDPGRGQNASLFAQIVETFTSGGAGTLQAQLVMADNAALDSNLEVIAETPALALADLVAGKILAISGTLPPGIDKRYLGVRYVVGTAAMTAGKVTAHIGYGAMPTAYA